MSKLTEQSNVTLKRVLGFWQCFGVAVGLVAAATTVISLCNYFGTVGPAFIITAAIAGIGCILIVMSYAEMATAIPGAGMIVDYTQLAMGKSMSIFAMFAGYIILICTAGSTELFIAGMSMEELCGIDYKLFATIALAIFLVINLIGVEFLGASQIILTVVKMAPLAILGILGLLQIGTVSPQIAVDFLPNGWNPVFTSLTGGIWLYIGMEYCCPLSEETINPEKNIPKAMIAGICTIFVCDMLFGYAITRFIPLEEIATSAVPQLVAARVMFGQFGFVLITITTVAAGASAANSHMASVPRMLYGLARDGMLPKVLAYLHPRFRTPWISIFVALACLSVPFLLNVNLDTIMNLINVAAVAYMTSYIIAMIDCIILRKKYPTMHRPFRAPLFPVPQVIGIIVCLIAILTTDPKSIIMSLIFMGVFMLYSLVWVKFKMKEKCFKPVPVSDFTHIEIKFDDDAQTVN